MGGGAPTLVGLDLGGSIPPRPLAILIHGTWARNTNWVRADSQMVAALKELEVDIARFEWSGKNNHRARLTAAAELALEIESRRQRHPHRPIHLIGHSHGGNVALYALRQIREAHFIEVTTLATPFLLSVRQPRSVVLRRLTVAMFVWSGLILLMFMGGGGPSDNWGLFLASVPTLVAGCMMILAVLIGAMGKPVCDDASWLDSPSPPDVCLVVVPARDEVLTSLGATVLVTRLASGLMSLLTTPRRLGQMIAGTVALSWLPAIGSLGGFVLAIWGVGLYSLPSVALALVYLSHFATGSDGLSLQPRDWIMTASATLPGHSHVYRSRRAAHSKGLNHSLCEWPDTIDAVAGAVAGTRRALQKEHS